MEIQIKLKNIGNKKKCKIGKQNSTIKRAKKTKRGMEWQKKWQNGRKRNKNC